MKHCYLILLSCFLFLGYGAAQAQSGFVPVGGDVSNEYGSYSYTLGQPADTSIYQEPNLAYPRKASFNEGMQQPYFSWELITSDQLVASIKIYPNPAAEQFSIEVENYPDPLKYVLYSVDGKLLQEGKVLSLQLVDIQKYAVGSFILHISTMDNSQENIYKIIKGQ